MKPVVQQRPTPSQVFAANRDTSRLTSGIHENTLRRQRKVILSATKAQLKVLNDHHRFITCFANRRFGKSALGVLKIIMKVSRVSPEPEALIWWVAPTFQQGRRPFRLLARSLQQAGLLAPNSVHRSEMAIDTITGWRIEFKSGDRPDNLLGAGLYLVVIDEHGTLQDELWYECIRPMLSDTNGEELGIGSARGARGWAYQNMLRGRDPEQVQYSSYVFDYRDAEFIPPEEVEEARRTMPDRAFRQEYLTEFLTDGGAVFEKIRERRLKPIVGEAEGIGVDWAKKVNFTVFTATGAKSGCTRAMKRFHHVPYPRQVDMLVAFCEERRKAGAQNLKIIHDQTGVGEALDDLLIARRSELPLFEGFIFTEHSRRELLEESITAFESEQLGWPEEVQQASAIATAIDEHEAFTVEYTPGGRAQYKAPDGMHDDTVMSVALSNRARRELWRNRAMYKPSISWI